MKEKITKDRLLCLLSLAVIIASYGAEKIIELFVVPAQHTGLLLAMIMTALLGVITLLLAKTNDSFMGLLAALIGYKMMPVNISFLSAESLDGSMLYYLVRQAARLIFIVLVFRLYNMQERPRKITALPLCAMLFAVPFFNGISTEMTDYFLQKTGSMLGGFLSQYACYAAASLIILALAFVSTYDSMRFATYFELAALGINILRQAAKIGYRLYNGYHISRSLYGWIILYVLIIAVFFIAKAVKKKNLYPI